MTLTLEERLAAIEARVDKIEAALAEMQRAPRPSYAVTIEQARERLKLPAERGPEELAQLRRFIGSFEGPEDMAEQKQKYLHGDSDE